MTRKPSLQPKLKPCPWCGNVPQVERYAGSVMRFRIGCSEHHQCEVSPVVYDATRAKAVRRWNERKESPDAPR